MIQKLITFLRFDPVVVFQKIGLSNESNLGASILIRNRVNRIYTKSGLQDIFEKYGNLEINKKYALFMSGHKKADIVHLYNSAKSVQTILEFGCGVSTIAMAYALKQNGKGKIYVVEADQKWAELVGQSITALGLDEFCQILYSPSKLILNDLQISSLFETLPNIRPDLIYLDGPAPSSVVGDQHGLTMAGLEFIVSADPLLYEWSLYAGAKIIVDGRINNVRFLQSNLRRKYSVRRSYIRNITTFCLIR